MDEMVARADILNKIVEAYNEAEDHAKKCAQSQLHRVQSLVPAEVGEPHRLAAAPSILIGTTIKGKSNAFIIC